MAYLEGTPPQGAQILTDHIKVCKKHPMREAEEKIQKLRKALIGLVGSGDKKELEEMEAFARLDTTIPDQDRAKAINAMHVLVETEDQS